MTEMLFTPKVLVVPCAESEMKWYRLPPPPWAAYDPTRRGREQQWRAFTLADQHGPGVLLCRAWGPDCTVQTCSLRDVAAEVGDVAIVGMNPDLVERLADALLGDD